MNSMDLLSENDLKRISKLASMSDFSDDDLLSFTLRIAENAYQAGLAERTQKLALALAFINEHCGDELTNMNHSWRCAYLWKECRCGYSKALAEIRKVLADEGERGETK